jgi:diaminopimelate decarboxylase/aspartate kinase
VVLKFGGSSVASAPRWERIGGILRDRLAAGERPLVVCSAVAGVSDLLDRAADRLDRDEALADVVGEFCVRHRSLAADLEVGVEDLLEGCCEFLDRAAVEARREGRLPPDRRPAILALGELLSTALGVRWLKAQGLRAMRHDARELLQALQPSPAASVEQRYLEARCAYRPDAQARAALDACAADVVITQGFIARDREGDTVLLGRGGSDTAAAYLAAKVGASRLEIWTDVPGLFSCNPHLVPNARFLASMDYDEAEALAGFGAQVLHPRTIHPVREAGIPLCVRWTERPDLAGTCVRGNDAQNGPKAVVYRTDVCLVTVEKPAGWKPVGVLADVTSCFKANGVPIDFLTSSPSLIHLLVDLSVAGSRERIPRILERLSAGAQARVDHDVASVTVVGKGLPTRIHALAPALEQLAGERVRMLSHCASGLSVTFVIAERAVEGLVRALHTELFETGPDAALTWRQLSRPAGVGRARTEALA